MAFAVFSKKKPIWASFILIFVGWKKYVMPFHILKKETAAELWLSHHIFSTTENSKNHSNENYRKMSEDSDTKESAIKSGGGCPAKAGMKSEGERYYFIKLRARNGFLEQIHSRV